MEVTANTTWRGVKLVTVTNMETGQMKIYTPPTRGGMGSMNPGTLLAETKRTTVDGNNVSRWEYGSSGADAFRSYYNGQNPIGGQLTKANFNTQWYSTGQTAINGVRTQVLSNSANYTAAGLTTPLQVAQAKENHFVNGVPGATQNGITINNDGTRPTQQTTGEEEPPAGPPLNFQDLDGIIREDKRRGGPKGGTRTSPAKILRYPLDEPGGPFQYDYISITAHDYRPSGLNVIGEAAAKSSPTKNLGPAYEKVIFPMQPQLSETNAVNWSDDQLNPMQAILGDAAQGIIQGAGDLDFKTISNSFGDLYSRVGEAFNEPTLKQAVAAYFAGQAVGANLQGRMTGQVINPNLELLFNGPNLRTFNFNFRLTPRTPEESEQIREIIFAFKRNMSVQRSQSNIFLRSPRLFQLQYIYKSGKGGKDGAQHPYLNKFKPCALTNFAVNYTPDGSYATYDETGSLTAYDLNMSFSEILPIYADDNKYTETPTDMGF
jgi:hypothetical protein